MTYREMLNRRLYRSLLLTFGVPVAILLSLVCGGIVAGFAEKTGILITVLGVMFLYTLIVLYYYPWRRCPYCGKFAVVPTKISFRAKLSDAIRIKDDVKSFPCCGGDIDAEIKR